MSEVRGAHAIEPADVPVCVHESGDGRATDAACGAGDEDALGAGVSHFEVLILSRQRTSV